MSSGDGGDAHTRLISARDPQDDLEARRMRSAVEGALFGNTPDPIKIGRHVILDRIGAGGVGMVYAAYDPELDRRVALKVLRPQSGFGSSSSIDAKTGLRREAQAMAQLSHPNVITVYEVGEVGEEIYISMELVEGEDLSQWLKRGPHPWREVIACFAQAARGLAAAHQAGLVHRDFKPSNVLYAEDGRVRVLDFGLAKLAQAPQDLARLEQSDSQLRDPTATYTGSVVGTPAYMAPEQHTGDAVDAKSDQFSFCVALFEALYGKRPFAGTVNQLAQAKKNEQIRLPEGAEAARIPARLRREVLRGLSLDPEMRHPSMEALVAALEHDPAAQRRRWGSIAVVTASLAVAATLWARRDDPAQVCAATQTRLAGIWDDEQRERVQTAFERTQLDYAPGSFSRVETVIDEYANAWTLARRGACEASIEDNSPQIVGQQLCLDSRLRDLAQVTDLLASADATIVQNAVEAVRTLPAASDCLTASAISGETADAEALAELQLDLTRARTLRAAGKYDEAKKLALELRARAAEREVTSIQRKAQLLEGRLEDDLGDGKAAAAALLAAAAAAETAGDDEVSIEAMLELVFVLGVSQGQAEAGLRWATLVAARIARAGNTTQEAQLLNHRGVLLQDLGKYEEATEVLTRALRLREEVGEPLAVASTLNNLGIVHLETEQLGQARENFERAYEITAEERGAAHPEVANPLGNLATVFLRLEDWPRAEKELLRAKRILEGTFGHEHPRVALTTSNLATVYKQQGRLDEALAAYDDAIGVAKRTLGEDHPMIGVTHSNVAGVLAQKGQIEEATKRYDMGLALLERTFGADHPRVVTMREARTKELAPPKPKP